ncbi:MAG: extracellular solute-binding protein [Spirochaetaceae bacterium]|jgi:raffinose/stachyose/melibiose transport system substrate-binding protein|nr:extracellular solute-binding protein [Spirochaetaceae bacterium]
MKIMAFLLLAICISCTGKTGDSGVSSGAGDSSKIQLKVLNYYDLSAPSAAQEIITVWDAFAEANPDIQIIREDLTNEPFHNKTEVYAAAESLPDVLYAWPSGRSTTLHENKLLKDLTPFIDRDGIRSEYLPAALDPKGQSAGYLAMLPRAMTSSHAFYINKEVLQDCGLEPAKTYAELKAQVPVLAAKGYGTALMANQDTWVMQSCLFSMIAGRFCGADWDKRILSGQAKFTDNDFIGALNFIKTLYDDGVLSRSSLQTPYGEVIGQFATNKGAYMIDGDWRSGNFITDPTTHQALIEPARQTNFDVSVFPDIEGVKLNQSTSGIVGTGWGMSAGIPAGSPKEEAAWKLVKWLSGKEVQTFLLETGGVSTPTITTIDMSALKLEPIQITMTRLPRHYSTTTSVIDGVFHSDVFNPLNDGLQEIGMGTGSTPEKVAANVQQIFDAWKRSQ